MSKQKNILDCKKEVRITVEYSELERFIKEEFNAPHYDIIAEDELNNDMTKTYHVEPREMDKGELIDFIRYKKSSFITSDLLDQLCYEGKIEPGKYSVEVSW